MAARKTKGPKLTKRTVRDRDRRHRRREKECAPLIGDRVRKVRGLAKQIPFAKMLDIQQQVLSKIENGHRYPSIDIVIDLYNKIGVNPTWLLLGEGEERLF